MIAFALGFGISFILIYLCMTFFSQRSKGKQKKDNAIVLFCGIALIIIAVFGWFANKDNDVEIDNHGYSVLLNSYAYYEGSKAGDALKAEYKKAFLDNKISNSELNGFADLREIVTAKEVPNAKQKFEALIGN